MNFQVSHARQTRNAGYSIPELKRTKKRPRKQAVLREPAAPGSVGQLSVRAHKEAAVSLKATWFRDRLRKKAKQGFQGFPFASLAR